MAAIQGIEVSHQTMMARDIVAFTALLMHEAMPLAMPEEVTHLYAPAAPARARCFHSPLMNSSIGPYLTVKTRTTLRGSSIS